ncbi:3-isopropylmalate dehydratase small subunit [Variovorax boronicumulans]|uniref:3-isopropylmalate dehydratase small subunit n=1 Tax=Variovorax boronicumulans TaxID=436515 RepID=UPI00339986DC
MMPFISHSGLVLPLDRANVDTDALVPKQFLKSISRTGFGPNLFDSWRYLDPHVEGSDEPRRENPDFILNRLSYRDSTILLARENFGCGSSREHAAWALKDYGFRALIAPSFSDIFTANAYKNGLLPVVLEPREVDALFAAAAQDASMSVSVDLRYDTVAHPVLGSFRFSVPETQKQALLQGVDDVGSTLMNAQRIAEFEAAHTAKQPWI